MKHKNIERVKTIICDRCGCSADIEDAVEGDDFGYYFCSNSCRVLWEETCESEGFDEKNLNNL